MKKIVITSLLSVFFLTACTDDETVDPVAETGMYENGIFVVNEGSFGAEEGSVTFVDEDLQNAQNKIYATANPTSEFGLGSVLQSMFFYGENAYLISNGSNLISIVDRNTFEFVGEIIGGLNAPRYGVVADGKAFVTNQASWQTSDDDFIAVIDLETLEVEKTIDTHAPVEYILEENGKIYVQNASFSMGNQVSVIDPESAIITQTVSVGEGLNSIEIQNNTLYALVNSGIKTIALSTMEVSNLIDFSVNNGFSNMKVRGNKIYYTSGNAVFSLEIDQPENPAVSLIENPNIAVLYGFAVKNDQIYIADAKDFSSNGRIFVYDISGNLVREIPVGVAPNGFYFNN
ncbi:MAG TPA: DUF5074 domain-containing protein [Flavobacteriaceae bacterium]|nr:DUF5074 domain-containing protein [Flavobacteriaceae bacterium]